MIIVLFLVPEIQVWGLSKLSDKQKFALKNEARKTLAQICGGAILLAGLYASFRTLEVSREGQLGDQYSKAVEELGATGQDGNPKLEIRIGGIYSLGRIAKTSETQTRPVANVLTSYLHTHTPRMAHPSKAKRVGEDIEAILHVLGNQIPYALELQSLDLRKANLSESDFSQADFEGSDLRGTDLQKTDLGEANLTSADLRGANLKGAHLEGVDLRLTRISQEQIDVAIGDDTTQLPRGLNVPQTWHKKKT